MRGRFTRRTEALLEKCPNNNIAEAMKKDKRRRENMNKAQTISKESLNPAAFTDFIGSYYNQDQAEVQLKPFDLPAWMKGKIENSMKRSKTNKDPARDGQQNEMIKIETALMVELIQDTWKLIGRTATYPEEWNLGFLTPIHKKGALNEPKNYKLLCMLPGLRRIVEAAMEEIISKELHFSQDNTDS